MEATKEYGEVQRVKLIRRLDSYLFVGGIENT